ncbi:hypothetical protein K504DRAFT_276002 [Pleomassaria siparia CBS 279.74]|uniref:Uncharacterized protein n=1 Tax=Pleomassaria siparia CBS 279.74 TaxID=1314801 RepID=A0A6G1K9K8_9PLEO|nr:hypothetical protein K504DRAFT_276002 [Pleomassaria siparia CBS 279.74]
MPIPSFASSLKNRTRIGKASKSSKPNDAPPGTDASGKPTSSSDSAECIPDSNPDEAASSAPPPVSHRNNADGAKRRSFLPQPGHIAIDFRTNKLEDPPKENKKVDSYPSDATGLPEPSTTTVASQRPIIQATAQGRLRPRSMYQTGSVRIEQHDGKVPSRSMRPPDAVSSRTSSVPQLAGLTRTQSLRRPEVSTQAHTRTQSINNVTATRKDSVEPRTYSERPRSLFIEPTQSINSVTVTRKDSVEPRTYSQRPRSLFIEPTQSTRGTSSTPMDNGGIRTSGRLAALKRTGTTRSKVDVIDRSEAIQQGRPAFSTLQQHFTPRKTGKAPTSTFINPPATDVGAGSLPSEITNLQSELLQLHLLHASAAQTSRQWELSAKRGLRGKFDEVASLYQVMRESERQGQELKNIRALREWQSGSSSFALIEHIQILSGPLHELPSLVDTGGRFSRLVDQFEHWTTKVGKVWESRKDAANNRTGDLDYVGGLGETWRAENASLTRRLIAFSRDMDRLTQPASDSTIAYIVQTCKGLLGGLLEELQTMQTIESGVILREQDWVEMRLKAIARGGEGHLMEANGDSNEVWRT